MFRKSVATHETYNYDWPDALGGVAHTLALASSVADPAEGPAAASHRAATPTGPWPRSGRAIEVGFREPRHAEGPGLRLAPLAPDFQLLVMDLAIPADPFARGQ